MVIWVVPMSYGHGAMIGNAVEAPDVAEAPGINDPSKALDTNWYDARATFYGDIHGGDTQQGACGYGNLFRQGYGLATAALSTALFNDGYTCGACYEIMCTRDPQWCLPGSVKITATNFCPANYSKTTDLWCNPPQKHFDLSLAMFLKIAKYKAGVVPVRYRRIPCSKTGGVKFETKGNPYFLMVLIYNVGGAGDIKYVQVKGNKTGWITMKKNWGQNWTTITVLTGQVDGSGCGDTVVAVINDDGELMVDVMVHGANVAAAPGTNGLDTAWYDARAAYYGDIHGGGTELEGACGYGDLNKHGYGLATAALSTALFNSGASCGACYEIMCSPNPQGCLSGSIKITATDLCPPGSAWCYLPNKHFDLSLPMFIKIAQVKAKMVPVRYRRVPCAKTGGVKFEVKGNPNILTILPYNVGGAGDIIAVSAKGSKTAWVVMSRYWGQNWTTNVNLTGQSVSLRVTTSDGITKDFTDVMPASWGFGQTFDGKTNF
ncbi:unnamed protein product [Arabidopsis thaliana]|uniref:(thale cress) hypothetical protein n=1 Tax=Arabidopsis thaliana TaxID=3702 RepID=A0A7G2FCB5_ARATH|nr:unnamed protein product [Arabidopsis thaliana]